MDAAEQDDALADFERGPLVMRMLVWAILGARWRYVVAITVLSLAAGAVAARVLSEPLEQVMAIALATVPFSLWNVRSIRRTAVIVPNDWSPFRRRPRAGGED